MIEELRKLTNKIDDIWKKMDQLIKEDEALPNLTADEELDLLKLYVNYRVEAKYIREYRRTKVGYVEYFLDIDCEKIIHHPDEYKFITIENFDFLTFYQWKKNYFNKRIKETKKL